ncbi:MAG: TonB-dependent receptor [Pseudomonadota bacterium]
MLRKHVRTGASWLALVAGLVAADAALAQTPGDGSLTVEEVVVTSRKREERLQDVPISVNVTGGEQLQEKAIGSLEQLNVFVPNLFIQSTPGNQSVYIRGIGSTAGNLGFEQSVGLFVDGVYASRSRQFAAPFLDVERVEVLRGPQGALFGKNTSAGAINITSRGPTSTFEAQSDVTATVEGEPGFAVTQILSGPVTDKLGLRLAVKASQNEGWLKNTTAGGDDPKRKVLIGRAVIDYQASPQFGLRLKLETARQELDGQPMATVAPGGKLGFVRQTTPGAADFDDAHSFNAALTGTYEFGPGLTLTAITGYSTFGYDKLIDSDFTAGPLLVSSFIEDFSQISQEVRIASPAEARLTWIAGAYYHKNEIDLTQSSTINLGALRGTSDRFFEQDAETVSIYAQATYKLTEALRLTAGARQTWDDKSADQTRARTGTTPPTWLATPLSGSRSEKAFDPSGQVQYVFNPDAMIYVSYGRGSKAGGFVAAQSTTTQPQFEFEGETATSAELGAKLSLFDRRLRLNIALYETKYEDLQVSVFNAQTNAFITGNAASATSRGVEVESAARLTSWLSFNGSLAYLDSKYDDFPGAGCIYPLPVPTPNPCTQNIAGSRIPRAPKWTGSAALDIDYPLSDALRLVGGVDVAHRSGAYLEETLNPLSLQKAYSKVDLRLGLADVRDRWRVSVIAKNLTDEITASHAFGTPFIAGSETFVVDPPRTVAVQAVLRY